MKTKCMHSVLPAFLLAMIPVLSQEPADKMQLLDLKLQLMDSKLELLDSKIRIWESKPDELDIRLKEIDADIQKLDFDPDELNSRILQIDSMISQYRRLIIEQPAAAEPKPDAEEFYQENPVIPRRYCVAINPVRVLEGTLEVSLERVINSRNAVELSAMATYANEEGISGSYFNNQRLEYYNSSIRAFDQYDGDNLAGFGTTLQWKNYLLPAISSKYSALRGLYAAPYAMFRRVWISGIDHTYNPEEDVWQTVEIVQKLNVLAGGVVIGWQFHIARVVTVDAFIGGVIRLCHYDLESGITKYKKIDNIDYSGVLPRAGIKIGILK